MNSDKPLNKSIVGVESFGLSVFALAISFALIGCSMEVQAGSLGKSMAKATASRLGKSTAQTTKISGLSKKSAGKITATKGHVSSRPVYRQLDNNTLSRINNRYGSYISPKRMQHARSTGTQFQDRARYQQQLGRSYPNMDAKGRSSVLGNYINGKTYVDKNRPLLPRTLAHERMHQLSHPGIRYQGGRKLDEGMTEHFSGKIYKDLHLKDIPAAYPKEQRIVQMMNARLGEKPLARAYFSGEVGSLRKQLDSQLGAGAFKNVRRALERNNYSKAEKILRFGNK